MKQTDIRRRLKQIAVLTVEHNNALKALWSEKSALQEMCTHTKTTETSQYYSGSYTDHACTEYSEHCDYCGKLVNKFTKEHSYFG